MPKKSKGAEVPCYLMMFKLVKEKKMLPEPGKVYRVYQADNSYFVGLFRVTRICRLCRTIRFEPKAPNVVRLLKHVDVRYGQLRKVEGDVMLLERTGCKKLTDYL